MGNVDFVEDTGKWVLLPSICDHSLESGSTMGDRTGLGSTTQVRLMGWGLGNCKMINNLECEKYLSRAKC